MNLYVIVESHTVHDASIVLLLFRHGKEKKRKAKKIWWWIYTKNGASETGKLKIILRVIISLRCINCDNENIIYKKKTVFFCGKMNTAYKNMVYIKNENHIIKTCTYGIENEKKIKTHTHP